MLAFTRTEDPVRQSLRIIALLLAAGLVALAAGCGGSKSSAPPTTTTQQDVTTVAMTTGTTPGGGGGFASAKNCRQFAGLATKIANAMSTNSGNPATALQTEAQELQALADAAPSDIKGDFQTIATAFSTYLQALAKAGYQPGVAVAAPSAVQLAALAKATKVFSATNFQHAAQHLSAWARQNCQ
jgi:hypothetical protein